jgi:gp16 family phage-associated protein
MLTMRALRTRQQAKQWFEVSGLKVSDWAKAHGLPAAVVYALLSGRTRGRYGDAHRAAVALKLKPAIAELEAESAGAPLLHPEGDEGEMP